MKASTLPTGCFWLPGANPIDPETGAGRSMLTASTTTGKLTVNFS
jgi:hypothetical protein